MIRGRRTRAPPAIAGCAEIFFENLCHSLTRMLLRRVCASLRALFATTGRVRQRGQSQVSTAANVQSDAVTGYQRTAQPGASCRCAASRGGPVAVCRHTDVFVHTRCSWHPTCLCRGWNTSSFVCCRVRSYGRFKRRCGVVRWRCCSGNRGCSCCVCHRGCVYAEFWCGSATVRSAPWHSRWRGRAARSDARSAAKHSELRDDCSRLGPAASRGTLPDGVMPVVLVVLVCIRVTIAS